VHSYGWASLRVEDEDCRLLSKPTQRSQQCKTCSKLRSYYVIDFAAEFLRGGFQDLLNVFMLAVEIADVSDHVVDYPVVRGSGRFDFFDGFLEFVFVGGGNDYIGTGKIGQGDLCSSKAYARATANHQHVVDFVLSHVCRGSKDVWFEKELHVVCMELYISISDAGAAPRRFLSEGLCNQQIRFTLERLKVNSHAVLAYPRLGASNRDTSTQRVSILEVWSTLNGVVVDVQWR
jgi:hypothetical protein